MESSSSLLTRAQQFKDIVSDIVSHLSATDHPEPSFTTSSPDIPDDARYIHLRDTLNDTASDVLHLVNGPKQYFRRYLCTHNDLAAYQVAFTYSFFQNVPESEPIPLSELAKKVQISEDIVGRTMRFLCTQRVFTESRPDTFVHTASSIMFKRDKDLRAAAEYQLDEMFKASSAAAASLDSGKSPFEERHGMSLFQFYGKNPKLATRFANAMAGVAKLDRQISELLTGYPWADLGSRKIVDVGGGSGHVSVALARVRPLRPHGKWVIS